MPGTRPGELLRDLRDPRLTAAYPRPDDMSDELYLNHLRASGLALVLPRADLAAGEYARAKAQAILSGAVVVVPYEADEQLPDPPPEPFDYVAWRRQHDADQRTPYERLP